MILGLDISTSIIGWTLLQAGATTCDERGSPRYDAPEKMSHIDLRKCKSFWETVDRARVEIEKIFQENAVTQVFIEDPVQKFRKGKSSAHTISLLNKFNALCSYFARQASGIDPIHIGATSARKLCNIPIASKKKANGRSAKEQTFDFLRTNVFKETDWPLTRNGNLQAYCWDEVDSYVIALAGTMLEKAEEETA